LIDLAALYLLAGLACAVAVWTRRRSFGSAMLALWLWPLWAPFALWDTRAPEVRPGGQRPRESSDRIARVLYEAAQAAAGTPFAATLSSQAVERIAQEAARASARLGELDDVLAQPGVDRAALLQRLAALEAEARRDEPASEATLRSARLHLASVERLLVMRRQQAAALAELEQMLVALRGQLVVARYAGSMDEGVDAIVGDLWARIEGLGEVLDTRPIDDPASAPPNVSSRDAPRANHGPRTSSAAPAPPPAIPHQVTPHQVTEPN
jgi:hypothetical protein